MTRRARGSAMKRIDARSIGVGLAAPLAAAIGCLQPGIDPVFLTVLSHASDVPGAAHGLVVGTTQAGGALGALAVWRFGGSIPRAMFPCAAAFAVACSLLTTNADSLGGVLPARMGYGLAMGAIYAHTMAAYARTGPNKAYAAVYLLQLLIATLASTVLPEAEAAMGARGALALLAIAPMVAMLALLTIPLTADEASPDAPIHAPVPAAGWALAAATFWFICATMLVWSFSAALAGAAGLSDRTIGQAVAIGSIVGAATALAVMRERLWVPLPVTALLGGAALAAPVLMTVPDGGALFTASIILLNIGSTALIIRCSGLASATSSDSRFRTFVACMHSLGTIAGPVLGTVMMMTLGPKGLLGAAAFAILAGLASVIAAGAWTRAATIRHPFRQTGPSEPSQVRMALD